VTAIEKGCASVREIRRGEEIKKWGGGKGEGIVQRSGSQKGGAGPTPDRGKQIGYKGGKFPLCAARDLNKYEHQGGVDEMGRRPTRS